MPLDQESMDERIARFDKFMKDIDPNVCCAMSLQEVTRQWFTFWFEKEQSHKQSNRGFEFIKHVEVFNVEVSSLLELIMIVK